MELISTFTVSMWTVDLGRNLQEKFSSIRAHRALGRPGISEKGFLRLHVPELNTVAWTKTPMTAACVRGMVNDNRIKPTLFIYSLHLYIASYHRTNTVLKAKVNVSELQETIFIRKSMWPPYGKVTPSKTLWPQTHHCSKTSITDQRSLILRNQNWSQNFQPVPIREITSQIQKIKSDRK